MSDRERSRVRVSPATIRRRRVTALIGLACLAFGVFVVVVVASRLSDDPPPAEPRKTLSVTIPEGETREQVAALLKDEGIEGDYLEASEEAKGFNLAKYEAEGVQDLEGFLFPATYELFKGEGADAVVAKQLEAFEQNFAGVELGFARSKNLTAYDVLTIASMVEEEVQVASERPLVASVIYNRLSAGMPLGIDATIRFATGNYTEPLTQSELTIDSPYNTRENVGLPPGPISSPSLESIEAAAKPADTDYLFFVVKPGTCPSEHAFAETEAEFFELEAQYNQARDAAGGRSPTC